MASDRIIELNSSNFDEATGGDTPLFVDFWAPWCGPCRMVAPLLEQLAEEMAGEVRIAQVNVDDNPELAHRFQVSSIPTFLIFADGEVKDRMMGALPKRAFVDFITRNL